MIQTVLSSLGVNGAKVDTIVDSGPFHKGNEITGIIRVTGGHVRQSIYDIDLYLRMTVKKKDSSQLTDATIQKVTAVSAFTINEGETMEFPFSMPLPNFVPFTSFQSSLHIYTDLNIKAAVDSKDFDPVVVNPSAGESYLLQLMDDLHGRLTHSETVISQSRRTSNESVYTQQLSFAFSYNELKLKTMNISIISSGADFLQCSFEIQYGERTTPTYMTRTFPVQSQEEFQAIFTKELKSILL